MKKKFSTIWGTLGNTTNKDAKIFKIIQRSIVHFKDTTLRVEIAA